MRLPFAPPAFRGGVEKILKALLVLPVAFATHANAQTLMPTMFDKRERVQNASLSTMPRIRFVTSTDFPPFNFIDQNGRLSGFHVDLVREICATLEIVAKCQIQALPHEELQGALERGEAEAVIAGIAITRELRAGFAFTRAYMTMPARFARNLSTRIASNDPKDLGNNIVGVVSGSRHEMMLRAFFPDLRSQGFASRDEVLDALKENRVAAAFTDGLRLPFWVAGEEAEKCCAMLGGPYISERFLGEGLAIMTRQQDANLVPALNHALAELSDNGRMQEIYRSYFPFGFY